MLLSRKTSSFSSAFAVQERGRFSFCLSFIGGVEVNVWQPRIFHFRECQEENLK